MDALRLGICCSVRNSWLASDLDARLTRNLGFLESLVIADDDAPVGEAWEQASGCTAVLVLLDSTIARAPVRLEAWQSLLKHSGEPPVAVVRLEDCHYPKLLERSRKFHAMTDPLLTARWVERWVVSALVPVANAGGPSIARLPLTCPAEWWNLIVDRPGFIEVPNLDAAQAFANQTAAHFDGVCWIPCEDAPPDALTAEIEYRGEGGRRLLFVLAGADSGISGALKLSRHSFVIVPPDPGSDLDLEAHPATAWLGACAYSGFPKVLLDRMRADEDPVNLGSLLIPLTNDGAWVRPAKRFASSEEARARCIQVLKDIFAFRRRWTDLCRELTGSCATALKAHFSDELCLDLALFLLDEGRRAEGVAWLRILIGHGSDEELRERAAKELSWLVDDFGFLLPQPISTGDQLDFGFLGFERPAIDRSADEQALLMADVLAAEAAARNSRDAIRSRQLRLPLA